MAEDTENKEQKTEEPSHYVGSSFGKPTIKHVKTSHDARRWATTGIIFFCFVAGFLGAWAAVESGLVKPNTETVNQKTVVDQESNLFSQIAQNVSQSVVSINDTQTAAASQQDYSFFGGDDSGNTQEQAAGTGIILSKNGYIITNKHVVPDGTTDISVTLNNGTTYNNVQVVARDPSDDLAFLKVNGVDNLQPASIGNSDTVTVGQEVLAIGNALGQYQNSVTHGIISGIGRPVEASDESGDSSESLENLLQTDAAINPGNSGGPLVNTAGRVIGIDTAVDSSAQGIGFAIPINEAKGLINSILSTGNINVPFLGVSYLMLNPSTAQQVNAPLNNGALVYADPSSGSSAVVSGSPADKAGIKSGDIITKVNGKSITELDSLSSLLTQYKPGDTVTLTIYRNGKTITLTAQLATFPASDASS
jgi:serine protease Do